MIMFARTVAITFLLGGIAFASATTFAAPMSAMEHEGMENCIFMEMDTLCAMSPLEHLALWQASFMTVAPQFALVSLILCIVAFALLGIFEFFRLVRPPPQYACIFIREREDNAQNPLQEAFSNGILNSKRY